MNKSSVFGRCFCVGTSIALCHIKQKKSGVNLRMSFFVVLLQQNYCINTIVSTPLTQMPKFLLKTSWSNHVEIFTRCTTIDQQIFYILYAEHEHLKFKELERAIKADAYSRVLSDKKLQSEMLQAVYPKAEVCFSAVWRSSWDS